MLVERSVTIVPMTSPKEKIGSIKLERPVYTGHFGIYSIGPIFLEHGQSYKKVYLLFSGVYNVVSVLDIEHILIRKPPKKKPQLFGL